MDAKHLKTEASQGERSNDGSSKYTQSVAALSCNSNKTYDNMPSIPLAKVETPTSRPCAVIGPDRVIPQPSNGDGFLKKTHFEPWPPVDTAYRQPPEYPHKMPSYQSPIGNISPRLTFQENMQRIMVQPTFNTVKINEDINYTLDRSVTKTSKHNGPADPKYCDVPYSVNPMSNDQKNSEPFVPNVNNLRNYPQMWHPGSVNMRPTRPYGAPELYQYPEYTSCAVPRPMPMSRTHRSINEDPGHMYNETFYHEGNIRFKPYPNIKERYPQARYEFVNNYTNPFHTPPPYPYKYDLQKSIPPHPTHAQVPMKYIENRRNDSVLETYQRPQQGPFNVPYRNQVIHPGYGPMIGNNLPNKMYPFNPDGSVKSIVANKLPYDNKLYVDYENARNKGYPVPDNGYLNEGHPPHMKNQVIIPNYTPNMQTIHTHPYYRKDNTPTKHLEYMSHVRHMDPSLNPAFPRLSTQFSPNTLAISPSDSNTSVDTIHTQMGSLEDCGYVSQSSTNSIRSTDSGFSRLMSSDFHRRYSYAYPQPVRTSTSVPKPDIGSNNKEKNCIDVRQFLQMWNEGDDENGGSPKETIKHSDFNTAKSTTQQEIAKNRDQLYVLGLVNVPCEELGKYEHIQKVSKLPDNIKGYNNIELLKHFEEAIESSHINNSNLKQSNSNHVQPNTRNYHVTKNTIMQALPPRPLSPLDVEAKISQSVIHKEVGCNFEIKPCSPEMLNVDIATPAQNILGERTIEKVTNPLVVKSPHLSTASENESLCNLNKQTNEHEVILDENNKIQSCKMINTQFVNNKSSDLVKDNYTLHDLESNSGVCLASLPRLDNDIELNFPEVNQQFINANKESVIIANELTNEAYNEDFVNSLGMGTDTEKEFTKLSKYRKNKRSGVESLDKQAQSNSQSLRTDSVIIKNPDNTKVLEYNFDDSITESGNSNDLHAEQKGSYPDLNKNHDQTQDMASEIAIDFSLNKIIDKTSEYAEIIQKSTEDTNDSPVSTIVCEPHKNELEVSNEPRAFLTEEPKSEEKFMTQIYSENICSDHNELQSNDNFREEMVDNLGLDIISDLTEKTSVKGVLEKDSDLHTDIFIPEASILNADDNMLICPGNVSKVNINSTEIHDNKICLNLDENNPIVADKIEPSYSPRDLLATTKDVTQVNESIILNTQSTNKHTVVNMELFNNDVEKSGITSNVNNSIQQQKTAKPESKFKVAEVATKKKDQDFGSNNHSGKSLNLMVPENPKSDVGKIIVIDNSLQYDDRLRSLKKELFSPWIQKLIIKQEGQYRVRKLKSDENLITSVSDVLQEEFTLDISISPIDNGIGLYNEGFHSEIADHKNRSELLRNTTQDEPSDNICNREKENTKLDASLLKKQSLIDISCTNDYNIEEIASVNNEDTPLVTTSDSGIYESETEISFTESNGNDHTKFECNSPLLEESSKSTGNDGESKEKSLSPTLINADSPLILNYPFKEKILSNRILKRSLSESALDVMCANINEGNSQEFTQESYLKRKKIKTSNVLFNEYSELNITGLNNDYNIPSIRRNSIASIYNEENMSFCIFIDNNCIITEENEEEKVCFAEISEECFATLKENSHIENGIGSNNEVILCSQENKSELAEPDFDISEEKSVESWVDDVACIETVVSDNIAEDIILSAPCTPENEGSDIDESNLFNINLTEKVKYIYGDTMCNDDAELVETLYRTPQMDVNKTLVNRESHVSGDSDSCEINTDEISEFNNNARYFEKLEDCITDTSDNTKRSNNPIKSPTVKDTSEDKEIDAMPSLESDNKQLERNNNLSNVTCKTTKYDTVNSCEFSMADVLSYNDKEDSLSDIASSSPEVSSTTSEEKSSTILLKITNYKGMITSQLTDTHLDNKSYKNSCKFTENINFSNHDNSLTNPRPLITKAAQKYIPPTKEIIRDLKVKLPLPQHSLIKLKQLKVSRTERTCGIPAKKEFQKKIKPKFEDVLKSIDELQFKMHKEKSKKPKKSVPKVVIKKNENGSHYASMPQKETFNPDLTGRKWQPWVFLEKNNFIDKMALRKKNKAIFNHRKNTYVFADKFKKYKSVPSSNFVISQPKLDNNPTGHFKYTIRLKHRY